MVCFVILAKFHVCTVQPVRTFISAKLAIKFNDKEAKQIKELHGVLTKLGSNCGC